MTQAVVMSVKPNASPTAVLIAAILPAVGVVFFKLARCVKGVMLITVLPPDTTPSACIRTVRLVGCKLASSR